MKTPLDLDRDIIEAAKALAKPSNTATERVTFNTLSKTLTQDQAHAASARPITGALLAKEHLKACGFRPFTHGQTVVTNKLVRALRDESGD
jgi:hypothetical protein